MNGITIRDTASPVLKMLATYGPAERIFIGQHIAGRVQQSVRDYLLDVVCTRHKTAEKLGAAPTGFWSHAVESVSKPEAITVTAEFSMVTIISPGISRVEHDVDIKPTGGRQYITIPLNAAAYGNRYALTAAESDASKKRRENPNRKHAPPGASFVKTDSRGAKWLFVQEAHLKQDRTLLPDDAALTTAAEKGCAEGINELIRATQARQQTLTQ